MKTKTPLHLGAQIAAANRDKTFSELNRADGFITEIDTHELFQRGVCKMAASVYKADGAGQTRNGLLFARLADPATPWTPGCKFYAGLVLNASGRCRQMGKQAFLQEAILAPTVLREVDISSPLRLALAAGLLGGAVGGTGLHFLSRNARQTSEENEALLQKAREYRRLRLEIDEDIANANIDAGQDERGKRHEL